MLASMKLTFLCSIFGIAQAHIQAFALEHVREIYNSLAKSPNVKQDDLIAQYAPLIRIEQGCYPRPAYTNSGSIEWLWRSGEDRDAACKSDNVGQIYARRTYNQLGGIARVAIIYTWSSIHHDPKGIDIDGMYWQFVVVYPSLDSQGRILKSATMIWTPKGGLSTYDSAPGSHRPWLVQTRSIVDGALPTVTTTDEAPALRDFPVFDVDGPGFPKLALKELDSADLIKGIPQSPLGAARKEKTLRLAARSEAYEIRIPAASYDRDTVS